MITRRNFLLRAAGALVCAPAIVRRDSLMTIRSVIMPAEPVYYGYVERLWINSRYRSGELRGPSLIQVVDAGVLQLIPPESLAYDIARWGLDPLPLAARKERAEFFDWRPAILPKAGPHLQPQNAMTANVDA